MSHNISLAGVVLPALFALHATAQIPEEHLRKIREAAPVAASVTPKQPRLMLIFSRSEGYKHSAIPYAAQALEILGKNAGAFATVQSEDPSMLLPENLGRFDAVCFNNTTQLKMEDPRIRRGLLEFIAGGKGIIGIHAATDNFPTWEEGQELFGGVFDSHPWTADGTWAVTITDPSHPINSCFGGKDFLLRDEIYRVRQVNLRKHSRVLLALDMRSLKNQEAVGVRISDKDIPISWVRAYGKGRLFYCSLGHNADVYWNPAVLKHYLDGIQFALGDLPAETTPVPFDPMNMFDRKALGDLLQRAGAYRHGGSRAAFAGLNSFIRWMGDVPKARLAFEQDFLKLLQGTATTEGKQFICEKLYQIGSDASVPTLAGMLADSGNAPMALYALEGIPGDAADTALLQALRSGHGGIGTVSALGRRRVAGGVKPLSALVTSPGSGMAFAAVSALEAIGSVEALRELDRLAETSTGALRTSILHAMVSCAEKIPGDSELVPAVHRKLVAAGNPSTVRVAAFRGLVRGNRAGAGALILQTLQGGDTALHPVAAMLVPEIGEISSIRSVAAELPRMLPAAQVQVLGSLETLRDAAVQRSVIEALGSRDPRVRVAAIRALGRIGNGAAVLPLSRAASRSSGDEQKEARGSLAALSGGGVADSLQAIFPGSPAPVKVEVLKAMSERGDRAMPLVLAAARDSSLPVRVEAARTLKVLAGTEEVPAMVKLLVNASDQAFRREMELAVASAARKSTPPEDGAILAAYPAAKHKAARVSLIAVLGKTAANTSLPFLRRTLTVRDADIRREALRALSAWPTAEPFADLWLLARTAKDRTDRTLALRGSVRLVRLDAARPADEVVGIYREAMRIAPDLAERKLLLSALGETPSLAALRTAAGYLGDGDLRAEAEAAMLTIAEGLPDTLRRVAAPEIRNLIAASADTNTVKRGKTFLAGAERSEDYITTWESSGPFGESAEPGKPLLDRPFAPELASGASWSPLPTSVNPANSWQLELDRLFRGEDFAVYLRAAVWSPSDIRGRLEIRNTYAFKVWWNGSPVHSSMTMRSFFAEPETVPVNVQKGWNTVMLKLEQGEDPWRAALRLRASDGGKLDGIRTAATQQ